MDIINNNLLDESELTQLLESPLNGLDEPLMKWRDKVALELLLNTGWHISKLATIKIIEINKIKFNESINDCLTQYLNLRLDVNPYLFINLDRARKTVDEAITIRSLERIIAKHASAAGITKSVTPRIIRLTYRKFMDKKSD